MILDKPSYPPRLSGSYEVFCISYIEIRKMNRNYKYGFHISRAYDTQFAKHGLACIMCAEG